MRPNVTAFVGAACALAGTILSGPIALGVVAATHPQPAWSGPEAFAEHYHAIQSLPYFAGLLLVGGFLALLTAVPGVAPEAARTRTRIAASFSAVFATTIFINYAVQTTFVPALLGSADPQSRALAGSLTMANPRSLGWTLEMWGYGVLGVATWLAAPAFRGRRVGGATAALFALNGPVSVLGAAGTSMSPGWVSTAGGLYAYAAWNALIIAMLSLAIVALRSEANR